MQSRPFTISAAEGEAWSFHLLCVAARIKRSRFRIVIRKAALMEVRTVTGSPAQLEAAAVVVGVYQDQALPAAAEAIDKATGGVISRLVERKEITGKHAELLPLHAAQNVKSPLVMLVGLGKSEELDAGKVFRAAGAASLRLADKERGRVAYFLEGLGAAELSESGVAGAIVGCHGQDLYKKEKKIYPPQEVLWAGSDAVIQSGRIIGESVNLARRLVNEPPSRIFPASFAEEAEQVASGCGLEIEIWDEERLKKERCGSLLAVAQGSTQPPRLVILRHNGGKKGEAPLALAGKGVTFDSGGLSLKPTEGMLTMKDDMAGGATVLAAMHAIARLGLPRNVIGVIGLVENMPSGSSFKLGDVLTARSGKTIEVHNTDAEGRLVLADVLDVAVERGAAKIIDLATLTGACMVALGTDVAGLMSNNQPWCDAVAAAARRCGEPAWQLPMFPEYGEQIRGGVADIKNVGEGRWGGAITAAKFLEEFVAGKPWTHIDIAGPAYSDKAKPHQDAGGTGAFVRTLVEIARREQG
jgi:leucyl aminopeptidase